ncbi:MAG TPA: hypothetical protein VFK14_13385 [Solirubrobacterales bacterium]|nr:hypothetical protein [Solirubrobacterales bacterium]
MDITEDDLKDERPRRGLFKDPAAVPVWAGITALDEATQHEVLKELRVRLVAHGTRAGDVGGTTSISRLPAIDAATGTRTGSPETSAFVAPHVARVRPI